MSIVKNSKCEEKVPWIGGKPQELCNLDDPDQRSKFGIVLKDNLKKGDYLVKKHDSKWSIVERKDFIVTKVCSGIDVNYKLVAFIN